MVLWQKMVVVGSVSTWRGFWLHDIRKVPTGVYNAGGR